MSNPAHDLAATGTPAPWTAPESASWERAIRCEPQENGRRRVGQIAFVDDAVKIARAVNALGPLGDLLDAAYEHRADNLDYCRECVGGVPIHKCRIAAARDAVVAALTGDAT